jgi:hypothetical protein
VLDGLSELVQSGHIRLVVPQVVIDEWNDNKQGRVCLSLVTSFRGKIKNAKDLGKYLPADDMPEFERMLEHLRTQEQQVQARAERRIEQVEALLNHTTTITLDVPDDVKVWATDLALARKAPFGNKGRTDSVVPDALVFLTALDYAARQQLPELVFVSANKKDFGHQTSGLHPDLQELSSEVNVKYYLTVGHAINEEIQKDLISEERVEESELMVKIETLGRLADSYLQATTDIESEMEDYDPGSFRHVSDEVAEDYARTTRRIATQMREYDDSFRRVLDQVAQEHDAIAQQIVAQQADYATSFSHLVDQAAKQQDHIASQIAAQISQYNERFRRLSDEVAREYDRLLRQIARDLG